MSSQSYKRNTVDVSEVAEDLGVVIRKHKRLERKLKTVGDATVDAIDGLVKLYDEQSTRVKLLSRSNTILTIAVVVQALYLILK